MIYLYSCSGSADHGCESSARAAKQLLGYPMRLYSRHVDEEYQYKMHELMDIGEDTDDDSSRRGRRFTIARMQTKFRNPEDKDMFFRRQEMLSSAKAGDIWLCMDEEAYCRKDAAPGMCTDNDAAEKTGDAADRTVPKAPQNKGRNRVFISGEELDDLLKGRPVASGSAKEAYAAEDAYTVASEQRAIRSVLSARGAKTVLWNCGVDAALSGGTAVAEDLKSYDLIVTSESITYEAVRRVNPNVLQSVDPAFLLPPVYRALPDRWKDDQMIGLQVSAQALASREIFPGYGGPDCSRAGAGTAQALQAICGLIEAILRTTNYNIMLIPYNVRKDADDRTVLARIFDKYADTGRLTRIADCNCMELKGYIARCRFFVGMHTQAAIAAWSSGVPSLIISDAVKAKGIARDLFGDEAHYVLPVSASEQALSKAFDRILAREDDIRLRLSEYLPEYKKDLKAAIEAIDAL